MPQPCNQLAEGMTCERSINTAPFKMLTFSIFNHYKCAKVPDQNVFGFLDDIIIKMEIVFAGKYLCSLINEGDQP